MFLYCSALTGSDCPSGMAHGRSANSGKTGWLAHSCGLLEEIQEVEAAQLVGLFDIGRVHNNDSVVVLPEWLLGR